ncbi:MAG: ROK family protein [Clostridia bacterium]|nr:ROK family protein [Clostridia bacterium]
MYFVSAVVDKKQSAVALYDKDYKILLKKVGLSADLLKLCRDVLTEGKIKSNDVEYIGVAVDTSMGDFNAIAADLEKNSGIQCYGATLMNARALGEAYIANDVPSLIMLKVDDTIECGVVIDKKLYAGTHQRGGNVAHTVVHFGGFECACGNRGCFEAYASNSGFRRIAAEAGVEGAETITHAKLFDMNTPNAERAKELYVKYFAAAITNLINLFQLDEFVLEGPFTEAGDKIMAPMMDIILREQFTHDMPNKCAVRFSNKEADTALIGAALLGR